MEKNMVCDMYSGICKPSEENEIETINFDVSGTEFNFVLCNRSYVFTLLGI